MAAKISQNVEENMGDLVVLLFTIAFMTAGLAWMMGGPKKAGKVLAWFASLPFWFLQWLCGVIIEALGQKKNRR